MDLVNSYAAALSLHPLAFEAVGEVAGEIIEQFGGERPDLVVCFASPHHVGSFEDLAGGLRKLLEPEVFVGCTAAAVAGGSVEVENSPGLSVFAARFGAGRVSGLALDAVQTADGFSISGWPDEPADARHLLTLADPYSFPMPDFLGPVQRTGSRGSRAWGTSRDRRASTRCRASAARRAQPEIEKPSAVCTASSARPETRPAPKRAANTDSPGLFSTSTDPPATAAAVQPTNTSGSSSLRNPPARSSNEPT